MDDPLARLEAWLAAEPQREAIIVSFAGGLCIVTLGCKRVPITSVSGDSLAPFPRSGDLAETIDAALAKVEAIKLS